MPLHKKEAFSPEDQELAEMAKALAHPARVAILKELAKRNSCICGEIVEVLPLAQSTVSQHLKELQKAGLISGTVEGVKSCYCINWEAFRKISDLFSGFYQEAKINNAKCC
jgi:ArsR family transcriptional regulator, arsenate/arsenite/antimonite-responsive transcriptional repressor